MESQPRYWKPPRPGTPGKKGPAAPVFLGSGQGPHFTLCPVPWSWEGSVGSVPGGGKRQRSPVLVQPDPKPEPPQSKLQLRVQARKATATGALSTTQTPVPPGAAERSQECVCMAVFTRKQEEQRPKETLGLQTSPCRADLSPHCP